MDFAEDGGFAAASVDQVVGEAQSRLDGYGAEDDEADDLVGCAVVLCLFETRISKGLEGADGNVDART